MAGARIAMAGAGIAVAGARSGPCGDALVPAALAGGASRSTLSALSHADGPWHGNSGLFCFAIPQATPIYTKGWEDGQYRLK